MKNLLIALLLVVSVTLGALYFRQSSQSSRNTARVAELEAALKQKAETETKAVTAEKRVKELRSRLSETTGEAVQKSAQVAQLQQALATETNNPMKGFAAMFKSPEMREMIKKQQKAAMGPVIEMTYGPLFKQLNLNADQATYLKELVGKKIMSAAELGMEFLSGDLDKEKRQELAKRMEEETKAHEAQIKEFLGDANYAQFEYFEKTQLERQAVGQFKDQLALTDQPLTVEQVDQLTRAWYAEREAFKWTTDYGDQKRIGADPAEMLSEERLARFAEEQARFDAQFLGKARQFLTPEQLGEFEKFQASHSEFMLNSMKLGAKFLAPKGK
jgi:hypothetical protein